MANCKWCSAPLPAQRTGRPRQFCSRGHRQRYYEWMRRYGSQIGLVALAERDGYVCGICTGHVSLRATGDESPSIDHIVPVARGGGNDPANLQLAHRICNTRKRDRMDYQCPPIDSPVEPTLTLFPWSW